MQPDCNEADGKHNCGDEPRDLAYGNRPQVSDGQTEDARDYDIRTCARETAVLPRILGLSVAEQELPAHRA